MLTAIYGSLEIKLPEGTHEVRLRDAVLVRPLALSTNDYGGITNLMSFGGLCLYLEVDPSTL